MAVGVNIYKVGFCVNTTRAMSVYVAGWYVVIYFYIILLI